MLRAITIVTLVLVCATVPVFALIGEVTMEFPLEIEVEESGDGFDWMRSRAGHAATQWGLSSDEFFLGQLVASCFRSLPVDRLHVLVI